MDKDLLNSGDSGKDEEILKNGKDGNSKEDKEEILDSRNGDSEDKNRGVLDDKKEEDNKEDIDDEGKEHDFEKVNDNVHDKLDNYERESDSILEKVNTSEKASDDIMMDNTDKVVIEEKSVNKRASKKGKTSGNKNVTFILLISILLSFVCGMLGAYLISQTVSVEQVVKNITTSELVENSISSSVDKVYDSTVVVIASANGKQISTGTGFIYKENDGKSYIMTNNHVIDGATDVAIEFNDGSDRVKADIVGGDEYADIAVLTIANDDGYKAVEIGDSDSLKLGDTIFTVGSPMGVNYKGTVTKGILSGKDRMVEVSISNSSSSDYYMRVIQIDAAVNPGNSGGPLCDVSGNVIGIISLKIVQSEVEGMGFAIPIEDAIKYANIIEDGGEITRPYIGISMLDLTQEYYLWQNRITIPEGIEEGVAVVSVEKGTPAEKAGLKKNDIIVKINDQDVGSIAEFRYELYKYNVGDKIKVTFYRDGKEQVASVTLGKSEN